LVDLRKNSKVAVNGSGSLGHGANAYSHSRPVPGNFQPFKRCE